MKAVSFLVMVHQYPEISVMGVCCTTQALTLGTGAATSGMQRSEERPASPAPLGAGGRRFVVGVRKKISCLSPEHVQGLLFGLAP